ncbi:ECF RNA polymerase sigma factor SigE [compost metagenome]
MYENEFFHNVPSEETPEASVLTGESRQELHAMLSMLPPNQQHAVLLYDIHGFSYQESANLMGIPLSHFKIILYRARQKLRKGRETA